MKCPNCGKEANFTEHSGECVETHGLDCGPYERWTETWLTCNECGAKTDDQEVRLFNPEKKEGTCDGCGKPCGPSAARLGDYDRAYTFDCPECGREYCAICLKDEPGYSADGDCIGDPPQMVDASSWRGGCRKCAAEKQKGVKVEA